jgi:cyclase
VLSPELIEEGASKFGAQCIVLAIDARRRSAPNGVEWVICTHGGRKLTDINALGWAKKVVELGAGEILLTSWDADGHRAGYDLELTSSISEVVTVPVIASGGAGSLEHLYQALVVGKADAVLAASIFHYGTYSIRQAKAYLEEKGIPVRTDQ